MIIDIFKYDKKVGTLKFSEKNHPICEGAWEDAAKKFIDWSFHKGITRLIEIDKDKDRIIVEEPIAPEDPLYPLAFVEWLQKFGYRVDVQRPEVDDRIKELIQRVPKGESIRDKALQLLPTMSYVEKTFILETLKEAVERE